MPRKTVAKPYNNGTMTQAGFWGMLRSRLRRASMYWKPLKQCKDNAKRLYKGVNKRQKWEYQCAECKGWFMDKEIQVDHIVEAGSLRNGDDLKGFVERLFCEVDGLQVLCNKRLDGKVSCHKKKSDAQKKKK